MSSFNLSHLAPKSINLASAHATRIAVVARQEHIGRGGRQNRRWLLEHARNRAGLVRRLLAIGEVEHATVVWGGMLAKRDLARGA